jgi:peptidoglycan pentaglycine glycine transferase (the first glycine)
MKNMTPLEWQQFVAQHSEAHILQTEEWGRLKAAFGWYPKYLASGKQGAMILFKKLPFGLTIAYIPKGPIGTDWGALMPEIDQLCIGQGAVFLKVEPDINDADGALFLKKYRNFMPESRTIQPRRSVVISLQGCEEDWLARMKQKTRYNIHLAKKKDRQHIGIPDFNACYWKSRRLWRSQQSILSKGI